MRVNASTEALGLNGCAREDKRRAGVATKLANQVSRNKCNFDAIRNTSFLEKYRLIEVNDCAIKPASQRLALLRGLGHLCATLGLWRSSWFASLRASLPSFAYFIM